MKRSSFSIQFFIRDCRIKKDGSVTIEVKITINGKRSFFSTGKNITAENWDKVKQIAKGKSEESQNINNFLKALKNRLYDKEVERVSMNAMLHSVTLLIILADVCLVVYTAKINDFNVVFDT